MSISRLTIPLNSHFSSLTSHFSPLTLRLAVAALLLPLTVAAQEYELVETPVWRPPLSQLVTERLDALVDDSLFDTSQVGIMVWDLDDDRPLYRFRHRQLLRPASTMKLVTAITALSLEGCSHKLSTELWHDGAVSGSRLKGNLYCTGTMDPLFSTDYLKAFARSIRAKGIKSITGRLVADCSFKDGNEWGEGWCWDDKNPTLTPLLINGEGGFAESLKKELNRQGISTKGLSIAREASRQEPPERQLLCRRSHTLLEVLMKMMKDSNNLHAETVFYQTAAAWIARAADSTRTTPLRPATAADAAAATAALLDTLGLPSSQYRIADGSGLSLYNYVSAECEVALLRYAWQADTIYASLLPTLPVAGTDGTLRNRMKEGSPAYRQVQAKTGTVAAVSSLAGYCTAANGHRLCFAIINQGQRRNSDARHFQDRVCEALCAP